MSSTPDAAAVFATAGIDKSSSTAISLSTSTCAPGTPSRMLLCRRARCAFSPPWLEKTPGSASSRAFCTASAVPMLLLWAPTQQLRIG
eukprot:1894388-Rhodomonas_salina.1